LELDKDSAHGAEVLYHFYHHLLISSLKEEIQREFYLKTQSVPRSKHNPVSVIKTIQLMLCTEMIAVYSEMYRARGM